MMRFSRRGIALAACLAVTLSMFAACSGTPETGGELYEKMLGAYGGKDNLDNITSFSGKGFIKQLPIIHVANSYPYDIYQNDLLLKTRMMNVIDGRLTGVSLVIADRHDSYNWSDKGEAVYLPEWEKRLLKYRFPYVLEWIDESGVETEIVQMEGDPNLMALRLVFGNDVLTMGIDKGTWLLSEIHVTSDADSAFLFREKYSDYIDLEGTWFPARFTAYLGPRHYYEYYLVKIDLGTELAEDFFRVLPEDTIGIQDPRAPEEQPDAGGQ